MMLAQRLLVQSGVRITHMKDQALQMGVDNEIEMVGRIFYVNNDDVVRRVRIYEMIDV
uniref:Uncharacterized protein n=1 Tax=Meloidogyne incognita TaxID=6306 RepID=A0A914LCE6_MELIC